MRHRSALVALLVVVCLAAGCRALDIGLGGSPAPSGSHGDGAIEHEGGDALLLRVEHRGGFVPYEYHLSRVPHFSLYGDGRVIATGAVPAIYPGPLLPPVLERRLTEDGVQLVLRAALDSGALERSATWNGAAQFVADAADTVFTLNAGGRQVTVSVYALGIGGDLSTLKEVERQAHEALGDLAHRLDGLDSWLPASAWVDDEWTPYREGPIRLVVRQADDDAPQDGISLRVEPWPIAGDPAGFGEPTGADGLRCGVVTGADAEAWWAALSGADQVTRWKGGGHRYAVTPRPLLPDEPADCQPAA
jgi:hypothetical protein